MSERFKPRVTIAIPVYNGSNFLAEAIDSALAQTYTDVEVIVVNDGSTDAGATGFIARSYGSRIVYVEQANGGVGAAMNTALAHMTGEVFTWLSHDDIHLPEKVSAQVEYYNRIGKRDAILFADAHLMNESGKIWHTSIIPFDRFMQAPMLALLNGYINGCTLFIPVHILREFGPFNEALRFTQDYDLWNKVLSKYEFFLQPVPLVKYRTHSGQDSQRPAALPEGDALWARMIDGRSELERVQMFGSTQRFFAEMAKFLNNTPYKQAAAHAHKRARTVKRESLVSIVLPFYNEVACVLRAIRSVQAQTSDQWELIVVDDGSAEDTTAVQAAVASDPRIRLVRQANAGAAAARNHGVALAEGNYIAFLDADDLFLPQKVQRQLGLMQEHGAVFSHTSYHVIFPERHDRIGVIRSGTANGRLYPSILSGCQIATPTVMMHRSLVARGFAFPTDTHLGEDVLSWFWVALRHDVLGIDEPLTVVEWSSSSAAINVRKGIRALTHLIDTLEDDPVHSRMREVELLPGWLKQLMRIYPKSAGQIKGPLLNEELIESVFPGV